MCFEKALCNQVIEFVLAAYMRCPNLSQDEIKKSRIQETLTLLTCADNSTV